MEALSKPELIAILQAATNHRLRNALMILVAYSHGYRASEVCGGWRIRIVNKQKHRYFHPGLLACDVRDGCITVARAKGSLVTVQPLVEDENPLLNERKLLSAYVALLHGKQRLFPVTRQHFWRLFQRYAKAAGIPERKRHPHILKHTIAMQVIHSAGIENTRQYLGHKSMSSTGAYLKVSDAAASAAVGAALKG